MKCRIYEFHAFDRPYDPAILFLTQILKGKVLQSDDVTLEEAGIVSKSMGAEGNEKFTQAARLMLVGSTPAEVQLVHELKEEVVVRNDLHGKAIPKGYKKVALNDPSARQAHWRYRCGPS